MSLDSVVNYFQDALHKAVQSNAGHNLKTKQFSWKLFFHNGLPDNAAASQDFNTLGFNYIGKLG